ncbi:hypothetical protein AB0G35_23685 [Streptomyces sp. NPDC021749]|uniref:hypothetical protein n=1 Tax=Streptomyces sp. NPDC021749 TaxID=3154905 RepID=UPI0033FEF798
MCSHPSHEPANGPGQDAPARSDDERLSRLETQVQTLAEAVRTLAQGLENIPTQDPSGDEPARGARMAHELLLSRGL